MTRRIVDPFSLTGQEQQRVEIEERLAALEMRPQLLPPINHPGRPVQPLDVAALDGYQNITSGTFVTCWDTIMDRLCHAGLFVQFDWQTQAGTTGEVRATLFGGLYVTSVITLGAASSGTATFRWKHALPLWTTTGVSASIEARRTGGANNVRIGPPLSGLVQVDPRNCTLTGV